MRKTPLAEVFFFLPGNGARKGLDGWRVVDDDDYYQSVGGTPSGRYDEQSSKLFPQLETKVCRSGEEKANTTEGDACKLRDSSGQFIWRLVQALLCEQQHGTCTHTTKYFVPNLQ
jgi:hypothetical protein